MAWLFPVALQAQSALPPLPSGQQITQLDSLVEEQADGQSWLILRFLAPRIARATGDLTYDDVAADMDVLCESAGLPAAAALGGETSPSQIVVVLLDRPVERGVPDPEATQFIGAYVPAGEVCAWD